MEIIILPICFVFLFFNIWSLSNKVSIKETLLISTLSFSFLLILSTEIFGAFQILNYQTILIFWLIIIILNLFYSIKRQTYKISIISFFIDYFKKSNTTERLFISFSIVLLITVFIQGIVYPPNNNDSMVYHMARIPSWISHQSIAYYPTSVSRQLYQPPFAEYVILHFNLLSRSDYFSNSVQFFFLLFSIPTLLLIIEQLGIIEKRIKPIAIVLLITIPEVILQASSTQNDIVVAFFVLSSVFFSIKTFKHQNIKNFVLLGVSVGIALLTKGTAYIYIGAIATILAIILLSIIIKKRKPLYLLYSLIAVSICLSINSGYYLRNYNYNKTLFGTEEQEAKAYSNEAITPRVIASSFIKNMSLHVAPYPISKYTNESISKLFSKLNIDINNPQENYRRMSFDSALCVPNHEDYAPNLIHFYLIILSFVIILIRAIKHIKENKKISLYLLFIFLAVLFFCSYLKWQCWHTRLQTPIFMLSVPLICAVIYRNTTLYKIVNKISVLIILYAFFIVSINISRPFISNDFTQKHLITRPISIKDDRLKKYFANPMKTDGVEFYNEYYNIYQYIDRSNCKNIGLDASWVYPLLNKCYAKEINPIYIQVTNYSKNITHLTEDINCIISTNENEPIIMYNGEEYYNQNFKNQFIWLYCK